MTGLTHEALVEAIARAIAIEGDEDDCFDRVDEWHALADWERGDEPLSDMEDCDYHRRKAVAAVSGGLPLIADAIEAAPIPFTRDRERMEWGRGVQVVMAEVVRGLLEADDDH